MFYDATTIKNYVIGRDIGPEVISKIASKLQECFDVCEFVLHTKENQIDRVIAAIDFVVRDLECWLWLSNSIMNIS